MRIKEKNLSLDYKNSVEESCSAWLHEENENCMVEYLFTRWDTFVSAPKYTLKNFHPCKERKKRQGKKMRVSWL